MKLFDNLGDPTAVHHNTLGVLVAKSWLLQEGLINVFLHRFYNADLSDSVHDHPWDSVSICLEGGMTERYMEDGQWKVRTIKQGDVVYRPAEFMHQLPCVEGETATTLYIVGPVRRLGQFTTRKDMDSLNEEVGCT
jgi:hypothetical protein